jgi:hypothetical protein
MAKWRRLERARALGVLGSLGGGAEAGDVMAAASSSTTVGSWIWR